MGSGYRELDARVNPGRRRALHPHRISIGCALAATLAILQHFEPLRRDLRSPWWCGSAGVSPGGSARRAEGEILVRVHYCALNALDYFVRRGVPGIHVNLPHISGGDVVGRVEQSGDQVGQDLVGRLVLLDPLVDGQALGESRPGGLAEYVVAPAANAMLLDEATEHPEYFAALPIAYGTAHRMLHARGRLGRGETVVVLGAAGGVGVACVQLALLAGARSSPPRPPRSSWRGSRNSAQSRPSTRQSTTSAPGSGP